MDRLIVWQNALIHLLPPLLELLLRDPLLIVKRLMVLQVQSSHLDSQILPKAWMRVVGRLNVTAGKRCCTSNQRFHMN